MIPSFLRDRLAARTPTHCFTTFFLSLARSSERQLTHQQLACLLAHVYYVWENIPSACTYSAEQMMASFDIELLAPPSLPPSLPPPPLSPAFSAKINCMMMKVCTYIRTYFEFSRPAWASWSSILFANWLAQLKRYASSRSLRSLWYPNLIFHGHQKRKKEKTWSKWRRRRAKIIANRMMRKLQYVRMYLRTWLGHNFLLSTVWHWLRENERFIIL